MHNPKRENSTFVVYRRPKADGPSALIVVEIVKDGSGTDIVNIVASGDRQLRQHEAKSDSWLDGRHSIVDHARGTPAEGEIPVVQPSFSRVASLDSNSKPSTVNAESNIEVAQATSTAVALVTGTQGVVGQPVG